MNPSIALFIIFLLVPTDYMPSSRREMKNKAARKETA